VRVRFVAAAEQLGITWDDSTDLVAVFDRGDCPATQTSMAHPVEARLIAAQKRSVALTEQAVAVCRSTRTRSVARSTSVSPGRQHSARTFNGKPVPRYRIQELSL
jgi:hypothetical protein